MSTFQRRAWFVIICAAASVQGDGGLRAPGRIPVASPACVAAGDLDGDGYPDILIPMPIRESLLFLPSTGGGAFAIPEQIRLGGRFRSLAVADLNGDGHLDVTATCNSEGSSSIRLNRGGGTFQPARRYQAGATGEIHELADMDGDGALDLVTLGDVGAALVFGSRNIPMAKRFRRGDPNADGEARMDDAILLLLHLFARGEEFRCADAAGTRSLKLRQGPDRGRLAAVQGRLLT